MGNRLLDHIIMELRSTKYLSVSIDSTPDISQVDGLTYTELQMGQMGHFSQMGRWVMGHA